MLLVYPALEGTRSREPTYVKKHRKGMAEHFTGRKILSAKSVQKKLTFLQQSTVHVKSYCKQGHRVHLYKVTHLCTRLGKSLDALDISVQYESNSRRLDVQAPQLWIKHIIASVRKPCDCLRFYPFVEAVPLPQGIVVPTLLVSGSIHKPRLNNLYSKSTIFPIAFEPNNLRACSARCRTNLSSS